MTLNRRQFFRFSAVAAAAAAGWRIVPSLASPAPVLIGDGIHDDGPAINAALAGEPFEDRNGLCHLSDGQVAFACRRYRSAGPLRLGGVMVDFSGAMILTDASPMICLGMAPRDGRSGIENATLASTAAPDWDAPAMETPALDPIWSRRHDLGG